AGAEWRGCGTNPCLLSGIGGTGLAGPHVKIRSTSARVRTGAPFSPANFLAHIHLQGCLLEKGDMAMRKALAVSFVVSLICFFYMPLSYAAPAPPAWQEQQSQQDQSQYQDEQGEYVPYSPEQLDNLLAPIALYPDPLLAQVLPAATFTDQIDDAARYVREYGQDGVDEQIWDVSVRAVAHYPEVLEMMDEKMDWTTAVGQAYVNQSTDVMESVQRLRRLAYDQGNLVTNPEWQIVNSDGYIQIWPASPQYIYV